MNAGCSLFVAQGSLPAFCRDAQSLGLQMSAMEAKRFKNAYKRELGIRSGMALRSCRL